MAPIAGRPYLTYLFDWLQRYGEKRIVLGLRHRAQAVADFLDRNASSYEGLTVVRVTEPRPRGTAGAAGVYLLSARLLDEIASGNAVSLEREVFGRAPAGSLVAFAGRFAFIDIGTPESLKLAERVFSAEFEDLPA